MRVSSRRVRTAAIAAIALAAGLASTARPVRAQTAQNQKLPILQAPRRQEATPQSRPVLTPDQVPAGALVPGGPPPAVVVFATGDVIGYLEPCG